MESNDSHSAMESNDADSAMESNGPDAETSEATTGGDDDTGPDGNSTGSPQPGETSGSSESSGPGAEGSSTGGSDTGDIDPGPACHPLFADCLKGEGCYPSGDGFHCAVDASGAGGMFGDPCAAHPECQVFFFCAQPGGVPNCLGNVGCCTTFCDTTAPPDCPGAGQECIPWYEDDAAPPGLDDVGACFIPN